MTLAAKKKPSLFSGFFRRLLHTYFLMQRGLTIGVRAIVQSEDGKFLLVRHTYTPGWHFPGGGVEKGETTEQAVSNELIQETGLRLVKRPVLHGIFYNNYVNKRDHILTYLCDVDGRIEAKPTSMEIAEVRYFNFEDLPKHTDPGTVRRIREIVYGDDQTESW